MARAFVGYLAINELRPKAEVDNTLRDLHISFLYISYESRIHYLLYE